MQRDYGNEYDRWTHIILKGTKMTDEPKTPAATGAKRGAKAAPANETKADKFKRLGNPRINNAVKAIGLLEALANKTVYDFTDDQRRIIEQTLDNAVTRVKDAFAGKAVPAGGVTL
jgi:nitrate reductase alpha subunit